MDLDLLGGGVYQYELGITFMTAALSIENPEAHYQRNSSESSFASCPARKFNQDKQQFCINNSRAISKLAHGGPGCHAPELLVVLETCLDANQTSCPQESPSSLLEDTLTCSTEEGAQSESSVTAGQTQCLLPASSKEGHV